MEIFGDLQRVLLLALGVAALALEMYALVDALRYPKEAYPAAGKLTKAGWVGILAVATAVGVVTVGYVMGFGVLGVVAAGVYLADVRPALRAISPRRRGRRGASGSGPYGSW
ncbi:DUF2516 family protein [Agilicoccus flavus]|uniref:DUF2516 family protein n=1 Tax=Agilicoccus flavus TaxID=2775968 RepID=UPI001CF6D40D|nr:DUF2516 family protein [Agilicoccus flavus]